MSSEVSAELVKAGEQQVAPQQQPADQLLAVIAAAARDPQVDVQKMAQLLDMAERIKRMEQETVFNRAMKAAQDEIKPVVRDAENSHTRSRYARLETIDERIRPIYTKHGFSLSFNSAEPREKGAVRVLCDVRHEAGHTKTYELEGALDLTGAKGSSNKTSIQGLGSSVSYLRRYLTLMIFNVTLKNEDNDGQGDGEFISEDQVQTILTLLKDCGIKPDNRNFLAWAGASCVEHISKIAYPRIVAKLDAKTKGEQ